MKKTKIKIISYVMSTMLVFSSTGIVNVFANNDIATTNTIVTTDSEWGTFQSLTQYEEDIHRELISEILTLNSYITTFKDMYGVDFMPILTQIVDANLSFDDEWINNNISNLENNQAISTINDSLEVEVLRANLNSGNLHSSAMSYALMHSQKTAIESANRNKFINNPEKVHKEVQYMFLSHYVDIGSYYTATSDDYTRFFNGHNLDGQNGILANWLTDSDRGAYTAYMNTSIITDTLDGISGLLSLPNNLMDLYSIDVVSETVGLVSNVNKSFESNLINIISTYSKTNVDIVVDIPDDITNITNMFISYYDSPQTKYMDLDEFANHYSKSIPSKNDIAIEELNENLARLVGDLIVNVACNLGSAGQMLGGSLALITGAIINANIIVAKNFFEYASWISLRYGYNYRYTSRLWDYMLG